VNKEKAVLEKLADHRPVHQQLIKNEQKSSGKRLGG